MKKPSNRLPQNRIRPSVPYDPRFQPDIGQFQGLRGDHPNYSPLEDNYTLSIYEGLPPRATQFYLEFFERSGDESLGEIPEATITLPPVPKGRTLILRAVEVSLPADSNLDMPVGTFSGSAVYDIDGFPVSGQTGSRNQPGATNETPALTISVNGSPDPQYSNIFINDAQAGSHHLPVYIIVPEDGIVSIRVQWRIVALEPIPDETNFKLIGAVYGDLLYSKGSDPILEPVNTRAVPIEQGVSSIVTTRDR